MKVIRCHKCGNAKDFYEEMLVVQHNHFHQSKNGQIKKVSTEIDGVGQDSHVHCSVCDEEIGEDYHLFLDRYSDTVFEGIK